jgi:DNA-binding response OmpR family regulator
MLDEASPICLVVDDDPGIRRIIVHTLNKCGMRPIECDSATAAARSLTEFSPALIFLDVGLGGSDATPVLLRLAEHGYKGSVQLLSGRSREFLDDLRSFGGELGIRMLAPLTKPFRADAIRATVATVSSR